MTARRAILSLAALMLLASFLPVAATENYSNWLHSKYVYFNTASSGANVSGSVVNFPVLIHLKGSDIDFSQANTGGADIRFAKADGTHLPYQIERWVDVANYQDTTEIWVKVDTVKGSSSSQFIIMYYGNTSAVDSSNGKAVFDTANGFAGCWHLNNDPSGAAPQIIDATKNCVNGTSYGSMPSSDLVAGEIGKALLFDGNNDYVDFGNGSKVNITGHNSMTFSTWIKFKALSTSVGQDVIKKGDHQYGFQKLAGGNKVQFVIYDSTYWHTAVSDSNVDTAHWFQITGVYNGANDSVFLYVNGSRQANAAKAAKGIYNGTTYDLQFGRCSERQSCYFSGSLDEAILSKTTRSSDWIRLSYQNQMPNQTLVSIQNVPENLTQWFFCQTITLNTGSTGANVTSSVYGFPALIRLNGNNFDFTEARSEGADIRFSKADSARTPLSFEIERWDSANQAAEIWVRVDTIQGNNATQSIQMYWGNSNVTSKSNSSAVFDTATGFAGVWHLDNNPGGTAPQIADETKNGLSGTSHGSLGSSDLITGVVNKGINFNGTNDYLDFGNGPKVNITGHNSITFSTWVKFNALLTGTRYDIMKKGDHQFGLQKMNSTNNKVQFVIYDSTYWHTALSNNDMDTAHWCFLTGVYNGGNDSVFLYVNGTKQSCPTKAPKGIFNGRNDSLQLGRCSETHNYYFNGKLDETVLSKVARSDAWINLCYQNQEVSQTLVKMGQVVALAANNSIVPNVVKAVLGADSSGADLVRPTAWLNASDSSQTVYYDFSQFAGYSAFDSVPVQIGAGALNSDYNPIIRVVNNFTAPPLSNHATIEEFDVTAGIYDTLSIPFPLQSQYQHTPKEYLLLQHFREDLNKWEILPVDSISNGLAYVKMGHNGPVAVSNMQDTSADTVYVDSAATGSNNGSSWANAYTGLQTALTVAADSAQLNTPNLIRKFDFWVAKGTYKPTNDTDRTKSFVVFDHVRMFGGFINHPPQTSTLNNRNPALYKTILSGDIGRQGDITDNTYSIVQADSARATIDGFTVTGGNTQGLYVPGNGTRAAGLDICNPRSTVINSCTFDENNGTNGTVSIWQTVKVLFDPGYHPDTIMITNCVFSQSYGDGGALTGPGQRVLYLQDNCEKQCIIDRCAFVGNYGTSVDAENLYYNKITNCVLAKNNNGSAIYLNNSDPYFRELYTDTIENCTFYGNISSGFGGAIAGSSFPSTAIENCIFWNDSANSGGSEISMSMYEPYMDSNLVHVIYCDIQGGVNGAKCSWEGGFVNNGGNLNIDPKFADTVNIGGADSLFATRDDGLRLKATSPCIDTCPVAGAPATDILGVARPWGRKVDMGAYEYFAPVTINFPLNDTLVGNRGFTIQYTNNGMVYDTTVTLTSDTTKIVISRVDALGSMVNDTETVRLDTKPPVIVFVNPSKDTAVNTNSLKISYTVDGVARDTTVTLAPAVNTIAISARDSVGNSSIAMIHILYSVKTNQVFAWAQAPQTAFTYQTIFLDARTTQSLIVVPTRIRWRQIGGGNYVCIADSTAALTSVLTRGPDNLAFELEVLDSAGILSPAFDTVHVTVQDPATVFDYLQLLTYNKSRSDNSQQITLTSPGMESSYYTTSDSITLSGTVTSITAADTIYWYAKPGIAAGFFVPPGADWSGLKVPVSTGDNLITLVYSCDSLLHVSADHVHVSRGTGVSFGDLAVNPDAFWIDSLMNFDVQMKTTGNSVGSVHLLQIGASGTIDLDPMNDYGANGDSVAGDSIYSTMLLNIVPKKDSVYFFRVEAVANGQNQYSAIYTFLPQVPYSAALVRQIWQINGAASSQYYSLKGIIGQSAAMDSVANWLLNQPMVVMAGAAPGRKALCWEFDCGVHAMICDGPDGTEGKAVKNKIKGLAPFNSVTSEENSITKLGSIGYAEYGYNSFKSDTIKFDVDSMEIDTTVTLDEWENWGIGKKDYKLVYIKTHGNTFGYDSIAQVRNKPSEDSKQGETRFPKTAFVALATRVTADTSFLSRQYWDLKSNKLEIPRMILSVSPERTTYYLTPKFFDYYDKNLDSCLLYISACRSLSPFATGDGSLWNILNNNHAKTMLGYTDYVSVDFATTMEDSILNNLAVGDTLQYAYDSVKAYCRQLNTQPGHFHIFADDMPADSSVEAYASKLKIMGDRNFIFPPSFYCVDLRTEADTNSFSFVQEYPEISSGISQVDRAFENAPPDSVFMANGPLGTKIPILNSAFLDFFIQQCYPCNLVSTATIRLNATPVFAKSIYFEANASMVTDSFLPKTICTIHLFFNKSGKEVLSTCYFTIGKNIRNQMQGLGLSANPPTDTLNWSNFATVLDQENPGDPIVETYFDMTRIMVPDSLRNCRLDSIGFCVPNLICNVPQYGETFLGCIYIYGISIQR